VTLEGGSTVTASNGYIRESIVAPDAKIVEGFPAGLMQVIPLGDDELQALVSYIATR
jgi:hypothetical protein